MMGTNETDHARVVARRQFEAFNAIGEAIAMTEDDRRKLLAMSRQQWSDWDAFLACRGALPPAPAVPTVLLRLARASYRLAVRADRNQGSMRAVAVPVITSLPS